MKIFSAFCCVLPLAAAVRHHIPEIIVPVPSSYTVLPTSHTLNWETTLDLDPTALAINFAASLDLKYSYVVKNAYTTDHNGIHHVYLRQIVDGLEVVNGDININIKDGQIISYGNSFYSGEKLTAHGQAAIPSITALHHMAAHIGMESQLSSAQVIESSETGIDSASTFDAVPFAESPIKSRLAYIQVDNGASLELVWEMETQMEENWLHCFVSAVDGHMVQLIDWTHEFGKFRVYPIGTNDPHDGDRELIDLDKAPDFLASPWGWNRNKSGTFTMTIGNNVAAQTNPTGRGDWRTGYRPTGANSTYDFPIDLNKQPKDYADAAVTNLFFWNNMVHDVFYNLGFDEKSGNFQDSNFGRGGRENDFVIANAQDGAGFNNANFATPPDGQNGRMRMYVWNLSKPHRDGDLDNGIIIHEYGHGISTRLTGGPANSDCLRSGEAGGMGEGWGDFWGVLFRMRPTYTRKDKFAMGNYSMNNQNGVRKYPYTTDMSINPETYAYINKPGYGGVHPKGEVWCGILLEAYWNLVDAHGFDSDWKYGKKGNNMMMQNVVDGLKLQPCRPTFVSARDAILAADKANYKGTNVCAMWKGFAKRGLGVNAKPGGVEDFTVPAECGSNVESFHLTF